MFGPQAFEGIIERHATLIEGAAFTFADTNGVTFPSPLAMIEGRGELGIIRR